MKKLLLIISCIILAGCGKDNSAIPDVLVDFNSPLAAPSLSRLNSAGGAVFISGYGYAGLIIYRRPDNVYVAYDAASTVNPQQKCAVTIDDPSLTATDPCSGGKFSLNDGSPVKAPAKIALKRYQVNVTSSGISVIN